MPKYLITCRHANGKKVTEFFEAESADEAIARLREGGSDEIVLHTDEVMALGSRPNDLFTPREMLRFRYLPRFLVIFLPVCLKIYEKNWIWHLLALGLLIYRRSGEISWGLSDTLLTAYLVLPVIWAFISQLLPSTSQQYHDLMEACSWGRWEEVLDRADQIGSNVPAQEIAFRKAAALSGLGRLDEGLRLVEPYGNGQTMPEWMYRSRLADVYSTAKRYDDAAAQMELALQLAPDNATVLVDIALSEVWRRRNPRRARDLLDRARRHALSDVLQPFATQIEGLIHLEEGRAQEASSLLNQAYQGAYQFRHASPLMAVQLAQLDAGLALAAAATGDMQAAQRHYRLAEPRIRARQQDWLIDRCERALSNGTAGLNRRDS